MKISLFVSFLCLFLFEKPDKTPGDLGAVWFLKYHYSSLITVYSIFFTHHSITHHLSLKISQLPKVACLALVSNFDNSKKFYFLWDPQIDLMQLLLLIYFLFFPSTPNTKLTEPSKKKKKKTKLNWLLTCCGSLKYVYLPKCYYNYVSITQKHLKVVFSFHNLSLKNQRIEW